LTFTALTKRPAWGMIWPLLTALFVVAAALTGLAVEARAQRVAKAASQAEMAEPVKAIGTRGAPITMIVFSDYECPSCRSLYEQTLRPLIADYVANGKVYLVHRDFPLQMHRYSWEAARWVNAAATIGKYPDVEAALYDNQNSWVADGNIEKYVAGVLSSSEMKHVQKLMEPCRPEVAGLRPNWTGGEPVADACPLDIFIERDYAQGMKIPVQATPTYLFMYKGQTYPAGSGVVSWPLLRQFMDQLLKQ
jgi:hypothetical protein